MMPIWGTSEKHISADEDKVMVSDDRLKG